MDIFQNPTMKKMLMKRFASLAKNNGWKKVVLSLDEKDELQFEAIDEKKSIVDTETYNFYKDFYNENKEQFLIK